MPYLTDAELAEIVPDLPALAAVEASAEVRAALTLLADRFAAMVDHPISPLPHKSNLSNPNYLHRRMEDMLKRPTVVGGAPFGGVISRRCGVTTVG